MLGRLGKSMMRVAARQASRPVPLVARFHTGRWAAQEGATAAAAADEAVAVEENADPREDPAGFGVDRANPETAPNSYWAKYLDDHASNVAAMPEGGWKGWEDLPAPYKYYHTKVDPKDVEDPGFVWNVFNNWFTGIPAVVGISTPLFIWNVIPIDSAFEYACIFWFAMAVLYKNAGEAIYGSLVAERNEQRKIHQDTAARYEDALGDLQQTLDRSVALPEQMKALNSAERGLRSVEADAATRQMLIAEVDRMEESLDFLINMRAAASRDVGTGAKAEERTFELARERLAADKAAQGSVIDDAIASLRSGEEQVGGLEGLLAACRADATAEVEAAAASSDEAARRADRDNKIFLKRFGMADSVVTEAMLEAAEKDEGKMAVLTARCVGTAPAVGVPLYTGNPLAYAKADA